MSGLRELGNIRKAWLYAGVVVAVLSIGMVAYILRPSEYQQNLRNLKKICADLTASNSEGRKYEANVGYFVTKKSFSMGTPSGVPDTWVTYKMVIDDNGQNKTIYMGSEASVFQEEIMDKIIKILGEKTADWQNAPNSNFRIGICTENKGSLYEGKVNTLLKM